MARLGHQRQVWRDRVVVCRSRRDIVRERFREIVGRNRVACRHFARFGIDVRRFDRPLLRDRLHLGLIISERLEIAESNEFQAMAGRADLLEHLEPALELSLVIFAERAVERVGDMPGRKVELMLHRRLRRFGDIGHRTYEEGDEQPAGKEQADEKCADANHLSVPP